MNHIYTTTKATILFVEFPNDAESIIYYPRSIIFADSTWKKTKRGKRIELPEGTWQFITLLKDAREDVAMTLVDSISPYENRVCYRDYEGSPDEWLDRSDYFDTAIESLHSLANSLGVKGNCAVLVKGGG